MYLESTFYLKDQEIKHIFHLYFLSFFGCQQGSYVTHSHLPIISLTRRRSPASAPQTRFLIWLQYCIYRVTREITLFLNCFWGAHSALSCLKLLPINNIHWEIARKNQNFPKKCIFELKIGLSKIQDFGSFSDKFAVSWSLCT